MTQHRQTADIARVLLDHGILRAEVAVNTATRGGVSGRTAVCLLSDEAVTLAGRQRAEIEQALNEAGYLIVRWADGLFWAEPKWVATRRQEARESTRKYRESKGAGI